MSLTRGQYLDSWASCSTWHTLESYCVTECRTLSPVPRLPVPSASSSVYPTTPPTKAGAAFHLVPLGTLFRPKLSAFGSEPPGRPGDPSRPVRSRCLSHPENAPAASPAAPAPDPAQHKSARGLERGARRGERSVEREREREIRVSTMRYCMFESAHTAQLVGWTCCCARQLMYTHSWFPGGHSRVASTAPGHSQDLGEQLCYSCDLQVPHCASGTTFMLQ